MPQRITVPGAGDYEFPDGISDDEISAAIDVDLESRGLLQQPDTLAAAEKPQASWKDIPRAAWENVKGTAAQTIAGMKAREFAQLEGATPLSPEFDGKTPEEIQAIRQGRTQQELNTARAAQEGMDEATPENMSLAQRSAVSAASSLYQSGAALAAGLATKSPIPALEVMDATTGGQAFAEDANHYADERIQQGKDSPEQRRHDLERAELHAGVQGGLEAVTEALPFEALIKPGTAPLKRLVRFLAAEIPGETLATVTQAVDDQLAKSPEGATVEDIVEGLKEGGKQIPETVVTTLMAGGVQSGAASLAHRASNRRGRAAAETPSPVAPTEEPSPSSPEEAVSPATTPQSQPVAGRTATEVPIATSDDQSTVPLSEGAGEGPELYQMQRSAGQKVGRQYAVTPLTEEVFQYQIRPFLQPGVANSLEEYQAKYPNVTHARLRMVNGQPKLDSVGTRETLVPEGPSKRVQSFDHPDAIAWGNIDSGRAERRSPNAVDVENDSLMTAISKLGGLSREEAEAQGLDPAHFRHRGHGIQLTFRKSGKSFDEMAEALHELGYPVVNEKGNYDPNVLLDQIDREMRGNKVFAGASRDAINQLEARGQQQSDETPVVEATQPDRPEDERALIALYESHPEALENLQADTHLHEPHEYPHDFDEQTKSLSDLAEIAARAEPDRTVAVLERASSDAEAARQLFEIIKRGASNERVRSNDGISKRGNESAEKVDQKGQGASTQSRELPASESKDEETGSAYDQLLKQEHGIPPHLRKLHAEVRDLERRTDAAYEANDPKAEDLDAELAEKREMLTSAGAELSEDEDTHDIEPMGDDQDAEYEPVADSSQDDVTVDLPTDIGEQAAKSEPDHERAKREVQSLKPGDVIVTDTGDQFTIETSAPLKNVGGGHGLTGRWDGSKKVVGMDLHEAVALLTPQNYFTHDGQQKKSGAGHIIRANEQAAKAEAQAEIDAKAHEAAPSPKNDRAEPTDAQKEAGNYKKGHVNIFGLDISIESPEGSVRRSKESDPNKWEVTMPVHYGYIKGTTGADGEHFDVFLGPHANEDGPIWVVDQATVDGSKFDESKAFIGFFDVEEAIQAYRKSFAGNFGAKMLKNALGWRTFENAAALKNWLATADLTKPASGKAPTVVAPASTAAEASSANEPKKSEPTANDKLLRKEWASSLGIVKGALVEVRRDVGYLKAGNTYRVAWVSKTRANLQNTKTNDAAETLRPQIESGVRDGDLIVTTSQPQSTQTTAKESPSNAQETPKRSIKKELPKAPDWWASKTGAEKFDVVAATLGVERAKRMDMRRTSDATWDSLTNDEQNNLAQQWGPKEKPKLDESALSSLFDEALAETKGEKPDKAKLIPKRTEDGGVKYVAEPIKKGAPQSQVASELVARAAKLGVKGADEALAGLAKLFGGPGSLKSFPAFDETTYAAAKPHFQAALASFREAGKTLKDLFKFMIENFGEKVKPYAIRFAQDEGLGRELGESNERATDEGHRPETLAREPSDDVRKPEEAGTAREGVGQRSASDEGRNAPADRKRRDRAGSVGANTGDLFADATGGTGTAAASEQRPAVDHARTERPSEPGAQQRVAAGNYRITDADELGAGGAKTKIRANLEAVRVLKELEAADIPATAEEQAKLVKYVGWGGLPQIFDEKNDEHAKEREQLKALLTPEEYAAARRSTQDAHYTSPEVVRGIYSALERLGFRGGKVLEPSVGSGNFIGLMPGHLKGDFVAVEMDPITGGIAKLLYPKERVNVTPFQDFNIARDYFDAVVGNPPFGNQKITDVRNKEWSGRSIHNYFFAKAIDSLRPGGVAAMVVSNYFLDAKDASTREYIYDKADLIGAIRLPNTAFKKNAGTEVTTDVIFLRRRKEGEARSDHSWLEVGTVRDPDGKDPIPLNKYFIRNPEMMAGKMARRGTMYGPDQPALIPNASGLSIEEEIARATANLPENVYSPPDAKTKALQEAATPKDEIPSDQVSNVSITKPYGYFLSDDDRIARRMPDVNGEPRWESVKADGATAERIKGLIGIRRLARRQLRYELEGAAEVESNRKELNRAYDAFQKKHGYIHSRGNQQAFDDDPDWPLLLSLEVDYDPGITKEAAKKLGVEPTKPSARKAPIFTKPVNAPYQPVREARNAKDALAASLAEIGRLDTQHVSSIYGNKDWSDIAKELGDLVYQTPEGDWVTADEYLSGNVKEKLQQAEAAYKAGNRDLDRNIQALKQVIPVDIEPANIRVKLGSNWIAPKDYEDFIRHLLGPKTRAKVVSLPALGAYALNIDGADQLKNFEEFGTNRKSATDIIEATMNNAPVQVYDTMKDDSRVLNQDETTKAQQKQEDISRAFKDWLWEDRERRERLTRVFNDKYNSIVERKFDGSHLGRGPNGEELPLPGQSPEVTLRRTQKNGVWRFMQQRGGFADHVVGAGKTYLFISTVMEMKRVGLVRKPLITVPNHIVGQWGGDFSRLYPGANVLVASKKDFEKSKRREFAARVATGDWDCVIMPHSSFELIGVPKEEMESFIKQQVADITSAIEELKAAKDGGRFSVKQLEKMKDRLEAKMESQIEAKGKDDVVTFDELGVDFLGIDEWHLYKNLGFATRLGRSVRGIGNTTGSQRAMDLFIKCLYIQNRSNGKGILPMTGTPIANSISEMYTVQRFMQYPRLRELGLAHFDSWVNSFAYTGVDWELDARLQYKPIARLRSFINLPRLMSEYRSFADVILADDLVRMRKEEGKPPLTPPLKGGKPTAVVVPRSGAQEIYMQDIINRIETMRGKDPKQDNMLKVTTDSLKMSLDVRLVLPGASDNPLSKVNAAAKNIFERYKQWDHVKGTQLVFCDMSMPQKNKAKAKEEYVKLKQEAESLDPAVREAAETKLEKYSIADVMAFEGDNFSVYDDLKAKLVKMGIPDAEIQFIHDHDTDDKKKALFRKVNRGDVRVLIGSTQKMGAGTNVQERLVAKHDLDAPWRPADLEQRDGRIVRQGNLLYTGDASRNIKPVDNFQVEIMRYVTERTYDAVRWQVLENKSRFIQDIRRQNFNEVESEDIGGEAASAAEIKAAASGNPMILEEVALRGEIRKLEALEAGHKSSKYRYESIIAEGPGRIATYRSQIAKIQAELSKRVDVPKGEFAGVSVGNVQYTERKDGGKAMLDRFIKFLKAGKDEENNVATYRGFKISFFNEAFGKGLRIEGPDILVPYGKDENMDPVGMFMRLDSRMNELEDTIKSYERRIDDTEHEMAQAKEKVGNKFAQADELAAKRARHKEVMKELSKDDKKKAPPPTDAEVVLHEGTRINEDLARKRIAFRQRHSLESLQSHVDGISKRWQNGVTVKVIENAYELPISLARSVMERGKMDVVAGLFDSRSRTAYVMREMFESIEQIEETLFHEVEGHLSVYDFFGDQVVPFLNRVFFADPNGVKEIGKQYGFYDEKGNAVGGNHRRSRLLSANEYVATLAEKMNSNSGGKVQKLWDTLVSHWAEWMRRIGFKSYKPSVSEIRGWLLRAQANAADINGSRFGKSSSDALTAAYEAAAVPLKQGQQTAAGQSATWDAPEPSKLDNLRYTLQDKHIDMKRVTEAIRDTTRNMGAIHDEEDPYLQEELFHGRSAYRVKQFLDDELTPLLKRISAQNVDMHAFEEYLWARHAQERNAQIAKINPEMPDGGSGMTNEEAADILANIDPETKRTFEKLATRVDAINKTTQDMLIGYGLESQATIDRWNATYAHYVPLMRDGMDGKGLGIGQGFSVRGPASKRAMGSKRQVTNIIANMALAREKAVVRGEKNRVANALLGLAEANPNPEFWKVDSPPMIRYVDPNTGLVTKTVDPTYKSRENVVVARTPDEEGVIHERAVVFNPHDERAARMAQALKNLDVDDLGRFLSVTAKFTRYFAAINTQFNPVFGIFNYMRDVQTAMLNLTSTHLDGQQKNILRDSLSALRGIYIDARQVRKGLHPTSSWAQLWEEFQNVGGQTGYRDMFRTSKDRAEAIQTELKKMTENKLWRGGRAIFDWLSDFNLAMENAVRLATYKAGKVNHHLSDQRAASIAKNVTVNFNRKGQAATQVGALYAFFNANAQGTARLAETFAGKRGKQIIAGGLLLGVMQAVMLAALGFDDDDPPEFVKERNFVLPIGNGKYVLIPYPLGFHFLPSMSRIVTEVALRGFRDKKEAVSNAISVLADAFNPIGNAGLSMQTIAPTVVDPLAAIAENKDWTGKKIALEDYDSLHATPGFTRAKAGATGVSIAVAKGINAISGGTEYVPGLLSPTPDQLDYLFGQATGGVGREVNKTFQTGTALYRGEDLPTYRIPLFGRLYGDSKEQESYSDRFYKLVKQVNEHEATIKGMAKDGRKGDIYRYLEENPQAYLAGTGDKEARMIAKLRTTKRELQAKGASREQIAAIEQQITATMRNYVENAKRLEKEKASNN